MVFEFDCIGLKKESSLSEGKIPNWWAILDSNQ